MMPGITSFDSTVLNALLELRSPLGIQAFSIITEFGSAAFAIVATALICLFLWRRGLFAHAYGLLFTVGGAIGTSVVLKSIVERARPPVEWRAVVETGYSLPSNHATASAALFGFLVYLTWGLAPQKWRLLLAGLCFFAILLVGFSRIYLGVHYFSDIIVGYAIGILFAWLGTFVVRVFK